VKSWDERWEEIQEDPKKFALLFKIIWIAAYSMLILGAFIIIYVLLTSYF
jgi:hypothetical protein